MSPKFSLCTYNVLLIFIVVGFQINPALLNGTGMMSGDLILPYIGPFYYTAATNYGNLHEATIIEYVKKQMLVSSRYSSSILLEYCIEILGITGAE